MNAICIEVSSDNKSSKNCEYKIEIKIILQFKSKWIESVRIGFNITEEKDSKQTFN